MSFSNEKRWLCNIHINTFVVLSVYYESLHTHNKIKIKKFKNKTVMSKYSWFNVQQSMHGDKRDE